MAEETTKNEKNEVETPHVPIITKIQQELKAPKTEWNNFGKYHYRTAESIETAIKPILVKYGAQLRFDEKMIEVGGRVYVEEILTYKDPEQEITVKGHAREDVTKKGMDGSQITGASSSYATKYALAKLFLIDDTKDADSYDNRNGNRQQTQYRQQAPQQQGMTDQELKAFKINFEGKEILMTEIVKEAVEAKKNGTSDSDPASKMLKGFKKNSKEWLASRLIAKKGIY